MQHPLHGCVRAMAKESVCVSCVTPSSTQVVQLARLPPASQRNRKEHRQSNFSKVIYKDLLHSEVQNDTYPFLLNTSPAEEWQDCTYGLRKHDSNTEHIL